MERTLLAFMAESAQAISLTDGPRSGCANRQFLRAAERPLLHFLPFSRIPRWEVGALDGSAPRPFSRPDRGNSAGALMCAVAATPGSALPSMSMAGPRRTPPGAVAPKLPPTNPPDRSLSMPARLY